MRAVRGSGFAASANQPLLLSVAQLKFYQFL